MKFWTIEMLRNPRRSSGFNHVNSIGNSPNGHGQKGERYRAWFGAGLHPTKKNWRGPARRTPEEAAQDYCDFVNGRSVEVPATLKSAGHVYDIDKHSKDDEEEAALGTLRDKRAQRAGKPGYVYLIIEVLGGGALRYGKIGYSTNPKKRVAELQTGNPRVLKLHALKRGTEADESALHTKYIELNTLQEWFWLGHRRGKDLLLEFDLDHNGDPWGAKEATP